MYLVKFEKTNKFGDNCRAQFRTKSRTSAIAFCKARAGNVDHDDDAIIVIRKLRTKNERTYRHKPHCKKWAVTKINA